jgi:hypothetical protein
MPDGSVIKGAQSNFPIQRAFAFGLRANAPNAKDPAQFLARLRGLVMRLFGAPWLPDAPIGRVNEMSIDQIVSAFEAVPYRGMFPHDGSCATLEDWFDPDRLKDDYVPTGFKGYGVEKRSVPGHEYGLKLSPEDKRALIAFLKTL